MKTSASALAALVVTGAVLAISAPANAASYVWTFTDPADSVSASGTFQTTGPDVVSGGGQANGDVLTLVPYDGITPDGLWAVDSKEPLDVYGLLFDGASGVEYNLWSNANPVSDGILPGTLGESLNGSYISTGYNGTLTVTAVPEPAAWALMIVGFGGVGAMMRIARRRAAMVVA